MIDGYNQNNIHLILYFFSPLKMSASYASSRNSNAPLAAKLYPARWAMLAMFSALGFLQVSATFHYNIFYKAFRYVETLFIQG